MPPSPPAAIAARAEAPRYFGGIDRETRTQGKGTIELNVSKRVVSDCYRVRPDRPKAQADDPDPLPEPGPGLPPLPPPRPGTPPILPG